MVWDFSFEKFIKTLAWCNAIITTSIFYKQLRPNDYQGDICSKVNFENKCNFAASWQLLRELKKQYLVAISSNCLKTKGGLKLLKSPSTTSSFPHNGHFTVISSSLYWVILSIHSLQNECSHVNVRGLQKISLHIAHSSIFWISKQLDYISIYTC